MVYGGSKGRRITKGLITNFLFIISCAGNHGFRCQLCSTIMVCSEGRSLYSFCLQPIADGVCSRLGSIDIGWHCVPWNVSHVHLASHYNSMNSKLIAVYCTALYNHLDLEFSVDEAVGPGCSFGNFKLKQHHLWTHAFSKSLETKVMKFHGKLPKKLHITCV
jgi:hypothetical protein